MLYTSIGGTYNCVASTFYTSQFPLSRGIRSIILLCKIQGFPDAKIYFCVHFADTDLFFASFFLVDFAQQKCKQKSIFASNKFLHQAKIIHNCDKAPLVMDFAKQNVRHHGLCQLCCKNAFLHSHHGFCFLFYKNITFSEIKCDNSDL